MPKLKPGQERKRVCLKTVDRKAAYHMLLGMSNEGELAKGAITMVADHFGVSKPTISRLWKQVRAKEQALPLAALDNQDDTENNGGDNSIYQTDLTKCRKGKVHDRP